MNHYVYLIEHRNALPTEAKYYIGVRSCECNVGDDPYMSSSKTLRKQIKVIGRENFNKIILKRFVSRQDAMQYEIQLHDEFDVANNKKFFNKAKQTSVKFAAGAGEHNHFYGKKHTEESKKLMSEVLKTKDCRPKRTRKGDIASPETKKIMSDVRKDWLKNNKHPMLGVKRTEEMCLNSSLGALNQQKYKCVHCDVVTIPANLKRWHNDNCKKKEI